MLLGLDDHFTIDGEVALCSAAKAMPGRGRQKIDRWPPAQSGFAVDLVHILSAGAAAAGVAPLQLVLGDNSVFANEQLGQNSLPETISVPAKGTTHVFHSNHKSGYSEAVGLSTVQNRLSAGANRLQSMKSTANPQGNDSLLSNLLACGGYAVYVMILSGMMLVLNAVLCLSAHSAFEQFGPDELTKNAVVAPRAGQLFFFIVPVLLLVLEWNLLDRLGNLFRRDED